MSNEEPGNPQGAFSTATYRFRYRRGVVGESQRVVHQSVFADDASVWSLCRRQFALDEVEEVERCGMPCLACTANAASAATRRTPALDRGSLVVEGSEVR